MAYEANGISFPGWEVVKKLGEGSFGGVYEIMRTLPDGTVERSALKKLTVPKDYSEIDELRSLQYDNESITAYFHDQMQDLVKEYSLMQKLGSNPNVVNCQDLQTLQHEDGIGWDIYIRMELLTPLKLVVGKDYKEIEVLRLAANLCRALNGCHQRNIIHRDIKPENILVSPEGEYKLGDFGIAKITEKTATGTLTGTYSYMAPEIFNHQHYGASADIYSLGLVMYWMMNERTLPFLPHYPKIPTAVQKQEAQERRFSGEPLPEPLNGSRELKKVVRKACAFDPGERYHSVLELMEDLRACYSGQKKHLPPNDPPVPTPPEEEPPAPAPAPPKPRLFPKIIAALTIIAVMGAAAILGAFYAFNRLNSLNERPPMASSAANSALPDTALDTTDRPSAVPATQSGVLRDHPNRMKAYAVEEDYFWGQNQIIRQEITKIVFTNEPITETYSWDISEAEDGSIMACVDEGTLYVTSDETILLNRNSSSLFARFEFVGEIAFNGMVDTSEVRDMSRMFKGCSGLTSLDLSGFNTANVTDMRYMFFGCSGLTSLDLSGFNTAKVTDMRYMFCYCRRLTSLDVSGFNTANVTNMSNMFSYCSSLKNLDVSGFNTANVTNMSNMFSYCSSLKNLDFSGFNTANVTNMRGTFYGCSSLTSLDVSGFNTANVTDMRYMFFGCSNLAKLDISGWDRSKADTSSMFYGTPIKQK